MKQSKNYTIVENNDNPFEVELWNNVQSYLTTGRESSGLFTLLNGLNKELKNISNCDNFLNYIMNYDLSSDVIVHTLSALSPIKTKLKNWNTFVVFSKSKLEEKYDDENVNILLQVII